ncbi:MAG: hypothetical protein J6S75_05165, partial [Thermoguttaceae bacterium]|nr:hypothetical protein [Thermoguttaceae bacterium]
MARPRFFLNYRQSVVTLVGLGLCLGLGACRTGGLSKPSADDPYAANAPRTKEEEAYYADVYSGEWKKERNLVGDLGIGKTAVATKPPAHWTMELPHGAKPMSQVYEENYQAQQAMAAQRGDVPYGGYPSDAVMPGETFGSAAEPPYQPQTQSPSSAERYGEPLSRQTPYSAPEERNDNDRYGAQQPSEEKPAWMNGWTFTAPRSALPLGTLHSIALAVKNMAGGSSGNPGGAMMRGQQADQTDEDSTAAETAAIDEKGVLTDPAGEPAEIPADPSLAESWRSINRGYLREESRKSENASGYEYIVNGGDGGSEAHMTDKGEIYHLESDETVASFETVDGHRMTEPSNRVRIYSPRFGSVRLVQGTRSGVHSTILNQSTTDVALGSQESAVGIDIRSQEERSNLARGRLAATGTSANQPGGGLSSAEGTDENIAQIRLGDLGSSLLTSDTTVLEGIIAAEGTQYVASWDKLQEVGVEIERTSAQGLELLQAAESVYVVETDTKSSKLR